MTRRLYRGLVRIHPPAFRREFGSEMLWIYELAAPEAGGAALCLDATVSLARQWLLRSGVWKVLLAVAGGLLQLSFAGVLLRGKTRAHALVLSGANAELAMLMRFTVLITIGLLAAVMFLVFWWRLMSRRRGA